MKIPFQRQASIRLGLANSVFVLLTACANFSGIQSDAKLKSFDSGDKASATAMQNAAWLNANWAKDIGGQALQDLIDAAIADSPSLQVAAARVASARAMIQATRANELPSVGASFDSTYQRFTENGLIPPPLAGAVETNNQLALNFSYDLDFWGKHSAEMRTALSQEKVALAEQQSARLMLSTAVAHAWVQLLRQYEQLDLSTQQLAIRNKFDEITRQRVKAGLDNNTDIQQSLLQSANLQSDINQWQEAIALTRNQLAALLGQAPERGQAITRPRFNPSMNTALPGELPLAFLGRRPDVVAARWRVESMQSEIDTAKTQFYPNINLIGFAGFSSLGLTNLLQGSSRIVGAGPAIRLPIFEGGSLRAQLKGRVAAYDGAVATYNQSLTDALREVADQVQSLKTAELQNSNQKNAEKAAEQTIKLAQQRQRVGTANVLPVLVAENIYVLQKKSSLELQVRRADLQINLIKALGGGYEIAPELQLSQLPASAASNNNAQSIIHSEAAQ